MPTTLVGGPASPLVRAKTTPLATPFSETKATLLTTAKATLLAIRDQLRPQAAKPTTDRERSAEALEDAMILAAIERDFADASRAHATLQEVDAALERIEDGDYGVCAGCEEAIPEKRLTAVPFAQYCIVCQEAHEATDGNEHTHGVQELTKRQGLWR